jgi:beta-N-acetylhexosaminidase
MGVNVDLAPVLDLGRPGFAITEERRAFGTDDAVQRVGLSARTLRGADERPFAEFSDAGGQLVMLSTAIYPALSHKPAAFSPAIATGELRERLNFRGVSITDALGTVSARALGGPARTAMAAARAGADLVLFTDLRSADRAQRALARGLRGGSLHRAEFEQSVARVLALRGG